MAYDLELIEAGKVYDNGTPALIDFNLAVGKGEFVAFLGPSGCGKTTTLRMIAGFESISSGKILIKGVQVNDVPPERRPTSMIFQNYALFPHMTVRRNIGYGLEVKALPRTERDARVARILSVLGLEDVADKRPDKLSAGQRQRVALARGLVVEPDILLLDEPLGALDANLRKAIQRELKLLQKRLGITFVFVTHAQSEALALSDRIVVMNQGRIEQISPPHRLYTRPNTAFVAQFIGRNTVLDGSIKTVEEGQAIIETPLGLFAGTANGSLVAGTAAKIVVPAEAIEVCAASPEELETGQAKIRTNAVEAMIQRSDVVGHVSHLTATISGGPTVTLEAHIDKYPPGIFSPGREILLSWAPNEATVIPAA
jgi:ABC-type Fe3+/spermidine/putrescine transport system ATPase subunit